MGGGCLLCMYVFPSVPYFIALRILTAVGTVDSVGLGMTAPCQT